MIIPHDRTRTVKGVETHYRLFTYEYRRECGHTQVLAVPFDAQEMAEAHQEWTARQLCPDCCTRPAPAPPAPAPREDDDEW